MKTNFPETNSQESHTSWLRRIFSKQTESNQEVSTPCAEAVTAKKPSKNQKVLVVDDDTLFLKIATSQLEGEGYDVVTAKDGCEAIEVVRKQKPNLVVLDVNLPQDFSAVSWDGFRVIEWLKRVDNLKNIPVVMMTGGDPSRYAREAIRAGAAAFFHKRTDQKHLLTLVGQTLMRRPRVAAAGDANFQI